MTRWTNEVNPFGQNRTPALIADASDGSGPVPLAADPATGRLLVNATGSSGGTSSTFGAAFPTTGTAVGASDGTNMQPLLVDGSGYLEVNVKAGGAGGTQYPELATTSPATGTLALGRYQTSFPTLTNGQMNEPMLDSSSRMIVNIGATTIGVNVPVEQSFNTGGTTDGVADSQSYVQLSNGSTAWNLDRGYLYNGSTWDRMYSAGAVVGTSGTGLLGSGTLGYDGTNWQYVGVDASHNLKVTVANSVTTSTVNQGTNPWVVAFNSAAPPAQIDNSSIMGSDVTTTNSGTQLVSLAGPTGDPLDTFGNALRTYGAITDNTGNPVSILNAASPSTNLAIGNNTLLTGPSSSQPIPWIIKSVTTTPSYYVGNYKWFSVQITSLYTGSTPTITFQGSNDNVNWLSVAAVNSNTVNTPVSSTSTAPSIYVGSINFLYFRLSFSGAYTSGQSQGTIAFSTQAGALHGIGVGASGTGLLVTGLKTNNAAIPAATNLGVLPNVANANPPGYTDTFQVSGSSDLMGQTRIKSETPLSINNQQIAGTDQMLVSEGVGLTALAGPTGDPVDTTGSALNVAAPQGVSLATSANPSQGALSWSNTGNIGQISLGISNSVPPVPVKTGGGSIYGWHIYNPNSGPAYLYFWDAPNAGAITWSSGHNSSALFVLVVPPSGWLDDPSLPVPIAFYTGLQIQAAGSINAGITITLSNSVIANVWYK